MTASLLAIYDGRMCHMALPRRTPIQQLSVLRAVECPGEKKYGYRHMEPSSSDFKRCFV